MKTMKLTIAAATILALCAGTAWTVTAETPPTPIPTRGNAPCGWATGKAMNTDYHLTRMTERLKLSDKQQTKIKPILDEHYKQKQAVLADNKLTRDQRRAKMQELRTSMHDSIKPILTEEQNKTATEMWRTVGKQRPNRHCKGFKKPRHHAKNYRMNPDEQLERMTVCLKLSDEQQAKIKPIIAEHNKQKQAAIADKKLTRDQHRAKMQELRTSMHDSIKPILTEEQLKQYTAGKGGPKKAYRRGDCPLSR